MMRGRAAHEAVGSFAARQVLQLANSGDRLVRRRQQQVVLQLLATYHFHVLIDAVDCDVVALARTADVATCCGGGCGCRCRAVGAEENEASVVVEREQREDDHTRREEMVHALLAHAAQVDDARLATRRAGQCRDERHLAEHQ